MENKNKIFALISSTKQAIIELVNIINKLPKLLDRIYDFNVKSVRLNRDMLDAIRSQDIEIQELRRNNFSLNLKISKLDSELDSQKILYMLLMFRIENLEKKDN